MPSLGDTNTTSVVVLVFINPIEASSQNII